MNEKRNDKILEEQVVLQVVGEVKEDVENL